MRSGFARVGVVTVAGLALLAAGIFLGREIDVNAEPEPILAREWISYKRPDAQLFRDARDGLQAFRLIDVPIGPGDLRLVEDPALGLIETAWFLVHKGEAEQKVRIAVWGSFYRVDAWTRGVLDGKVEKTFHSQAAEREIQETIEALRHSRRAAVRSPATLAPTAPPRTNYATGTSSSSTRGSVAVR